MMTKGSLCSGYGGLDMATPGALSWYAENDADAASIMGREHPGIPNFSDITVPDIDFPHVDLLLSGDPCQSLSAAGHRRGRADERYLWPHVRNIIARVMPEQIFMENVQNIVSLDGGVHLAERLDALRALGYEVRWTVLGACAIGAPHHRHRWFLRARRVNTLWAPDPVRVAAKCGAPRGGSRQILPTPRATDGTNGGPGQRGRKGDLAMGSAVQAEHWGKFADAIALWEQITGRPAPCPTEPAPRGGRRLNAELSEWMMGLDLGYVTKDRVRNEALKRIGNGVVPLQARTAWDLLEF